MIYIAVGTSARNSELEKKCIFQKQTILYTLLILFKRK